MTIRRSLLLFFAAATLAAAQPKNPDAALGAARHLEEAEGNYPAAIEAYKKFLAQYGNDRARSAKALVRMGQCYEKLGDGEARKAYERVVREFGDQKDSAEAAHVRLAALGRGASSSASRRLYLRHFRGFEFWQQGAPSSGGRYHARDDDETGDLVLQDLVTGQQRRLTNHPPNPTGPRDLRGDIVTAIFSRDDQWIAYTLGLELEGEKLFEMHMIKVDGTGDRLVFTATGKNGTAWFYPVSFTADGAGILVTFNRPPNFKSYHVGMVDVKTGTLRTIREMPISDLKTRASLSPDGRYVAFHYLRKEGSKERNIAVIDLQSNQETKLVESPAHDANPLWTPDGKALVFESDRNGSRSLWKLAIENGRAQGDPVLLKADIPEANIIGFDRNGSLYYLSNVASWENKTMTVSAELWVMENLLPRR